MAFTSHNRVRSGVNSMPFANERPADVQIKRISNRVYRQCAKDGFNARLRAELAAELAGSVPANLEQKVPLYSHSATRQSYYNKGWHAVTHLHVLKARADLQARAKAEPQGDRI